MMKILLFDQSKFPGFSLTSNRCFVVGLIATPLIYFSNLQSFLIQSIIEMITFPLLEEFIFIPRKSWNFPPFNTSGSTFSNSSYIIFNTSYINFESMWYNFMPSTCQIIVHCEPLQVFLDKHVFYILIINSQTFNFFVILFQNSLEFVRVVYKYLDSQS